MERCKGCGAPRWWSDATWSVYPGTVNQNKCFGCMMDWETSEESLENLREMMWQALLKLDSPQRNMAYYTDLAQRVAEIHDEIEDRLYVDRHFISTKYIEKPVNGTLPFAY